jgi:hypothetical protein
LSWLFLVLDVLDEDRVEVQKEDEDEMRFSRKMKGGAAYPPATPCVFT